MGLESLHGRLIDLHLHVDGSISVPMARRLAAMGGQALDGHSDEELFERLSVGDRCEDLNEYLRKFEFPLRLLQTFEQVSECVYLLQEELRELGLAYAELRFAPQLHCDGGMTQREVVAAALEGLGRSSFDARLILCCMRGSDKLEANLQTVGLAAENLGRGVVAIDLAGAEALYPTADFEPVFARARELAVPMTLHAGEADGPSSVRAAIAAGAARIGHGVRSVEDPELVRELAARQLPLELCPTSELQTGALAWIDGPELRTLLDKGCVVTINSDNMAVSNTWVGRELELVANGLELDEASVRQLLLNALEASFAEDELKARLRWLLSQD